MCNGTVLITGGAGFIGSHTANAILRKGYKVQVYDNLQPPGDDRALWVFEFPCTPLPRQASQTMHQIHPTFCLDNGERFNYVGTCLMVGEFHSLPSRQVPCCFSVE
jgi:nucleoside-diphosphate-sugar epimerase